MVRIASAVVKRVRNAAAVQMVKNVAVTVNAVAKKAKNAPVAIKNSCQLLKNLLEW